jgi:hypothetical protein
MRFRVLDEAKDELAVAASWYDTERAVLAQAPRKSAPLAPHRLPQLRGFHAYL